MDRDEIIKNLGHISLDDETYDQVTARYPRETPCPTCQGRGMYNLDGRTMHCDCELQRLLQKHYFLANIGREYHDICFNDFLGVDKDNVIPIAMEYLENYEDNFHYGIGVTVAGGVGTGKTFVVSSILKEIVKRGKKAYFISFEELIDV